MSTSYIDPGAESILTFKIASKKTSYIDSGAERILTFKTALIGTPLSLIPSTPTLEPQTADRAIRDGQSHVQTLTIYKLGFNQNYYTFTLTLLIKIVLCSKVP